VREGRGPETSLQDCGAPWVEVGLQGAGGSLEGESFLWGVDLFIKGGEILTIEWEPNCLLEDFDEKAAISIKRRLAQSIPPKGKGKKVGQNTLCDPPPKDEGLSRLLPACFCEKSYLTKSEGLCVNGQEGRSAGRNWFIGIGVLGEKGGGEGHR